MPLQESAGFTVTLHLSTENGELPSDEEVHNLIIDQMGGLLDDTTGLKCDGVYFLARTQVF